MLLFFDSLTLRFDALFFFIIYISWMVRPINTCQIKDPVDRQGNTRLVLEHFHWRKHFVPSFRVLFAHWEHLANDAFYPNMSEYINPTIQQRTKSFFRGSPQRCDESRWTYTDASLWYRLSLENQKSSEETPEILTTAPRSTSWTWIPAGEYLSPQKETRNRGCRTTTNKM